MSNDRKRKGDLDVNIVDFDTQARAKIDLDTETPLLRVTDLARTKGAPNKIDVSLSSPFSSDKTYFSRGKIFLSGNGTLTMPSNCAWFITK